MADDVWTGTDTHYDTRSTPVREYRTWDDWRGGSYATPEPTPRQQRRQELVEGEALLEGLGRQLDDIARSRVTHHPNTYTAETLRLSREIAAAGAAGRAIQQAKREQRAGGPLEVLTDAQLERIMQGY